MIQAGEHTIYFGGDTAYWHHFSAIAKEFPSISAALLPVGPCEPAAWMQRTHMNPAQALKAALDLRAQRVVPMHWGAFSFGADHFDTPHRLLQEAWQAKSSPMPALDLVRPGQTVVV